MQFPRGGAMELSMCDNSLFSDFKDDIRAVYNSSTDLHRKREIVEQVWKDFPTTRIKGYWRKCGYREHTTRQHTAPSTANNQALAFPPTLTANTGTRRKLPRYYHVITT